MDPLVKAALERIEKAIDGRALSGYSGVIAGDVALVAGHVPEPKQTEHTKGLAKAAANNKPGDETHMRTEMLAHLVSLAKG